MPASAPVRPFVRPSLPESEGGLKEGGRVVRLGSAVFVDSRLRDNEGRLRAASISVIGEWEWGRSVNCFDVRQAVPGAAHHQLRD